MIEVNNVNKTFRDKQVLFDISAKFEQGKTNLIIGQSGSGKTVLLKSIVGLQSYFVPTKTPTLNPIINCHIYMFTTYKFL